MKILNISVVLLSLLMYSNRVWTFHNRFYRSLSNIKPSALNKISSRFIVSMSSHDSGSSAPQLTAEEEKMMINFKKHQESAARLSFAEETRTLIEQSLGYGVLSTNSIQFPGYPTGSIVGFATNEEGLPFFSFSTMSAHTKDISKDGRVSLTITSKDFKGAAEGRVVLIGDIEPVTQSEDVASMREKYLARHKDAYWVQFGDFLFYKMTKLIAIRFVGGFAMAGSLAVEDYKSALPDAIANFASPVMTHMNDDHQDSLIAMVNFYTGIPCTEAKMISLDRLGMTVCYIIYYI